MRRVIIAGGGLAGGLAALALAQRSDIELLLVEQQPSFGGNHVWSFFDTDVASDHRGLIDPLVDFRWPDHEVHFPRRSRAIAIGYNSVRSQGLDFAVKRALRPDQYRLGQPILDVRPTELVMAGGERLKADAVIDARGAGPAEGLELGWQKFVGRIYQFSSAHRLARPVIMDATVDQLDGYRFLYFLPLSRSRLLIEDTYYSLSPVLDTEILETRIEQAAAKIGSGPFAVVGQESGVLPVVLRGNFDCFWPSSDQVPRLGVRGGFFHPTTSYSIPDAVANSALLAEQQEFSPVALSQLLRGRAERLWDERAFYRLLNRMLFHAAQPSQAYKVLEHFYRLPQDLIARFYAGRLTSLDKLRVLSGKPPIPLGRALRAIRRRAA